MDPVEEIKDRLDVDEVVGGYVQLKQAGRNFKGVCPFHEEKTPSFVVSPEKGVYHCFGCGEGGDIFTFVQRMDGLDFRQALERLGEQAGVELPDRGGREGERTQYKQRLREASAAAAQYYHIQLGRSSAAKEYIQTKRQFSNETIKTFQLGYAPSGGRRLVQFLGKQGFSNQELIDAGLARSYRGQLQDMFRERIMVPFFDVSGHVIGFTGRALGEAMPKYLNTPQTALFDKSRFVFGFYQAKDSIRSQGEAVVVEGNLDVLQSHQAHVSHVVAISGTALTKAQVKQLGRLGETITFAFDADSAGLKATERALPLVQEAGIDLYVVRLPEGQDPDDVIRHNPADWERLLSEKTYVVDWLLKELVQMYDINSAQGKRQLTNRAVPVLQRLQDSVEREHYVQRLADMVGVAPATIAQKLQDGTSEPESPRAAETAKPPAPPRHEIATVATALLCLSVTYPDTRKALGGVADEFLDEATCALFEHLRSSGQDLSEGETPKELHAYTNYVNILLLRGEEEYGQWSALDRQVEAFSLAHRLHELQTKHKKQHLSQQIAAAEAAGDDTRRQALLQEFNDLHA